MNPLSTLGIGAMAGLLVGGAAGWPAQGGRSPVAVQTQVAVVATERADAATAARTAEADQRQIEFNRMEANAQITYNDQVRRDEIEQARPDNAAAVAGVRIARPAAEARASGGQDSSDTSARTGADDPRTLRIVAGECTSAFEEMAGNAVSAGSSVTGLQEYATALE